MVVDDGVVARGAGRTGAVRPGQFCRQPNAAEGLERVVGRGEADAGDLVADTAVKLVDRGMGVGGREGTVKGLGSAPSRKTLRIESLYKIYNRKTI